MLKKFLYTLWISVFAVILFFSVKNGSFATFVNSMENRTFDIRQSLIVNSGVRQHNKDIVIVAIDDASYEYILDNYGEWPLRRDMYAKMVDYIEAQSPKSIAFDFMFVKSMKSDANADNALINIFNDDSFINLYMKNAYGTKEVTKETTKQTVSISYIGMEQQHLVVKSYYNT